MDSKLMFAEEVCENLGIPTRRYRHFLLEEDVVEKIVTLFSRLVGININNDSYKQVEYKLHNYYMYKLTSKELNQLRSKIFVWQPSLYGEKILENLKIKMVKTPNIEKLGHKGIGVKVTFPKIGDFEGWEFSCFKSYDKITGSEFESNPEYKRASYSKLEWAELLEKVDRYIERVVSSSGICIRAGDCLSAGDCLKQVVGLNYLYWLSNGDDDGVRGSRALLNCFRNNCDFDLDLGYLDGAYLFLKESV